MTSTISATNQNPLSNTQVPAEAELNVIHLAVQLSCLIRRLMVQLGSQERSLNADLKERYISLLNKTQSAYRWQAASIACTGICSCVLQIAGAVGPVPYQASLRLSGEQLAPGFGRALETTYAGQASRLSAEASMLLNELQSRSAASSEHKEFLMQTKELLQTALSAARIH